MIHFAWPFMALALPLPWLAYHQLPPLRSTGKAVFFPMAQLLSTTVSATTTPQPFNTFLRLVLWMLLISASMRPQWLGAVQPVFQNGRQIFLAIDASGSMATRDMAHSRSRLEVVQDVAGAFIQKRQGDQIGLIVFGTRPYLQAPLTQDLQTANRFLQESMVGEAGPETAIGDAIGLAIRQLHALNQAHPQMILILLTDGGNNTGLMPPEQAAQLAAKEHLRIYTIGVGAAVENTLFGTQGNTDLDEPTLQNIAKITGGLYFRATDAAALNQVYSRINQLEPVPGKAQWYRPTTEYFYWPLAIALLFSLLISGYREWYL